MYINVTTGDYPVSENDIRAMTPNVSFANPFVPPANFKWVFPAPQPSYDPKSQHLVQGAPNLTGLGHYEQTWEVITLAPEQVASNELEATLKLQRDIITAMDNLFDTTAQSKKYDSRVTCALRAGYTGPFQAEGIAFAQWMDTCNALGYQMLAEVQAGTRPMPSSVAEALALLPEMIWPN